MLHFIREKAKGWVAWFIVALISIPFALWGVNSYMTGPSDVVVAKVNGERIKQVEYQQAFQQYRDRMRDMLGDKFDPTLFDSIAVKQSVLDGLIEQKLLLSASYDLGQQVSKDTLVKMIKATPAFQQDGVFNSDRYSLMLNRANFTPERYEAELFADTLRQELAQNIQKGTVITQSSIDNAFLLEKQMREVAFGVIPALSLVESITVEESEVQIYFDEHKINYMAPERISVDYIELSVEQLSKNIDIDESDLQTFYVDNQDQFVGPEQRKASHILIEGKEEEAFAILDEVKKRLAQGEDFALIAKELSQDAGSASDGGDLGFFERDVMDPDFEKTVFSMLKDGDVSDVVETEFGYHLIQLTGIKNGEGQSFYEAKSEIELLYRKQEGEKLFYEQAELLADLSYENPDSLDIVSEELGLEIKTSEQFLRMGNMSGIAKEQKIATAGFSEDVLTNDLNSAVIELSKSHLLVMHKNKHVLASQLSFDSVSPAITEQLRFTKARNNAVEQGEAILSKVKAGEDAKSLFDKINWIDKQTITRTDSNVSEQISSRVFAMEKPVSSTQYEGFTADNGNYIVLMVSAITEADATTMSKDKRELLRTDLTGVYADSELQAFIKSLRDNADIDVFEKYL